MATAISAASSGVGSPSAALERLNKPLPPGLTRWPSIVRVGFFGLTLGPGPERSMVRPAPAAGR
jgi:hypothetical protein